MSTDKHQWSMEKAVEVNRVALTRIVAELLTMITAYCGQSIESAAQSSLPHAVRRLILRSLLPAESAARRIIYIFARRLAVKPPRRDTRPFPVDRLNAIRGAQTKNSRNFQLFETAKTYDLAPPETAMISARTMPRISVPGHIDPSFHAVHGSTADTPASPVHIFARLKALDSALSDVPKRARRMAKMIAKKTTQDAPIKRHGSRLKIPLPTPLRIGQPPGLPKRKREPAHLILADVAGLVRINSP